MAIQNPNLPGAQSVEPRVDSMNELHQAASTFANLLQPLAEATSKAQIETAREQTTQMKLTLDFQERREKRHLALVVMVLFLAAAACWWLFYKEQYPYAVSVLTFIAGAAMGYGAKGRGGQQ